MDEWLSGASCSKTTVDVEAITATATALRVRELSLRFPRRLNDNRLRDVAGAVDFDGRVLLAETMQRDPRRRTGMRVSCVSEAAVTPFWRWMVYVGMRRSLVERVRAGPKVIGRRW